MAGRHRVLLYTIEDVSDYARECTERLGAADRLELVSVTHDVFTSPTAAELAGAEAVLGEFMPVRGNEVQVMADAGVRLVASMSIGINHVDVAGLAARGVAVSNCPGYCADDVALHAVTLMLDLMRQVTLSNRDVLAGNWNPRFGREMRRPQGQTCGLVFFGNIARKVVPLVKALGMDVLVWAPTKSAEELAAAGCRKAQTLDELLAASDVVSLHCPLIPQTERLIGARELALMKPSALLVNTARGAVVDEDALADALESGAIAGAGLDVLAVEKDVAGQRLPHCPNCIVTPHLAYVTREANEALVSMSMKSVCELLIEGREPEYVVRP